MSIFSHQFERIEELSGRAILYIMIFSTIMTMTGFALSLAVSYALAPIDEPEQSIDV